VGGGERAGVVRGGRRDGGRGGLGTEGTGGLAGILRDSGDILAGKGGKGGKEGIWRGSENGGGWWRRWR
jgi:hypothetical protein